MLLTLLMRLYCHPACPRTTPLSPAACRQLMHTHNKQNKFKLPRSAGSAAASAADGSSAAELEPWQHHQQQSAASTALPKVIVITGPTAVGKTKLGLELAKRIGGEIISADSVQVYRGLDIGSDKVGLSTAVSRHAVGLTSTVTWVLYTCLCCSDSLSMPTACRPSPLCLQLPFEQREGIPHHLIDILDPAEEFSVGDFHSLGRKAAEDIIAVSVLLSVSDVGTNPHMHLNKEPSHLDDFIVCIDKPGTRHKLGVPRQ